MPRPIQSIAIIGAGKVGTVLAQLALKAGYTVYISGSGDPAKIALSMKVLAPGAQIVTTADAARAADVSILALPLGKFRSIPADTFAGKLVIDAMNYWWEVDGPLESSIPNGATSSEAVQEYFKDARVVKAFNHSGYHDLYDFSRPVDEVGRKAIAIAGNDPSDTQRVAQLVDSLGFDPLIAGELSATKQFEPGGSIFGVSTDIESLRRLLS